MAGALVLAVVKFPGSYSLNRAGLKNVAFGIGTTHSLSNSHTRDSGIPGYCNTGGSRVQTAVYVVPLRFNTLLGVFLTAE